MNPLANHFPLVLFKGSEKWLYNPVLRKRLANRPEERVRLQWVEYLLHQTEWKKTRIGFEAPVKLRQEKNTLRADLLLYTKEMQPHILFECKSEQVALTGKTAVQAARYNVSVEAPFICLTNGLNHRWFQSKNGSVDAIQTPLCEVLPFEQVEKKSDWWSNRGFISPDTNPAATERLHQICAHFWSSEINWPVRYLNFSDSFLPFGLNHYYRLPELDHSAKMAISFLGAPGYPSYLVAVLNESGQNRGFLSVNLDKLFLRQKGSAVAYTGRKETFFDAHEKLSLFNGAFNPAVVENLPDFLIRFFD